MSIYKILNTPISIKTEINNGALSSQNAMPQKNSTSDNQSSFSADRRAYTHTITQNPKMNVLNQPYRGMPGWHNGFRRLPTVFDGTHSANQKKWHSNRDASEVTRKNRVNEVGLGTLNASGQIISFDSHANNNTVESALRRVRGGGSVAPAKKGHNTSNAYSPSPMNIPLVPALKVVNGYKMPPTKYSGPLTGRTVWQYQNQNTP
jgi:hypothetical protein